MKVLVAGGTGFVGTALVRELTARNHEVTVLARSPEDADLSARVDHIALDLTSADADAVHEAVAAQDAVVNLVALSPLFTPSGGNEMHEMVHLGGTEALVTAAEAAGVSRFVQMSALGADVDGNTHYIRAKGRAEAVVRDSSLDWVIVRPSVVFGDGGEFVDFTRLLTTPYASGLPGGGSTRFQPIWVGDLAPMLADCVDEEEDRGGETYELGGPEVVTLADVARHMYTAEGKSLRVLPIPMALAKLGLTIGGVVPGFRMGPDQYRSLRFDNTIDGGDTNVNDVRAFGVEPGDLRTLDDYLAGDDAGGSETDSGLVFVSAKTLGLFAFLSLARFLPGVVDIYSVPGLVLLFIPPYLVNIVFYDGIFGLEAVVYALEGIVGESSYLWDAGLLVTYYLFSVVAVTLGRLLKRRFSRVPADANPSDTR